MKRSAENGKSDFLKVFFAVTETSMYRVSISGGKETFLEKIACRGASVVRAGEKIDNGTMVSIGVQLIMFVPDGHSFLSPQTSNEREIAHINTQWWGGGTSSVVALFLSEARAKECNESEGLVVNDPRWKEDTIEVLRAIGLDHPYCAISSYSETRLMAKDEWCK